MTMTAREIVEAAKKHRPRFVESAMHVEILDVVPGIYKKTGGPIIKCITRSVAVVSDKGVQRKPPPPIKKYQTVVYGLKPGSRLYKDPVKVSCNCDSFVFWGGEWALHKKGAADILYGNGEPPDMRNPKYRPWGCKHVIKVLMEVLKNKV